jgi:Spy/CpxP family protein refolding chaperone
MRISFLKIALTVSLIFNITVLVTAGYFYYKKDSYWVSPLGIRMQKGKFLFEGLSLRPEQIKSMREEAIPCRAEIDRKRQVVATNRDHLFSLMRAETPDANAIKTTVAEITRIQGEVESMVTMHILKVKATLDKEQQKKFLDLIENAMLKGRQPGCPSILQNQ